MAYFNYLSVVLICIFILVATIMKKKRAVSEDFIQFIESNRFEITFIVVALIISAELRLIGLSELSAGMNQDEASKCETACY